MSGHSQEKYHLRNSTNNEQTEFYQSVDKDFTSTEGGFINSTDGGSSGHDHTSCTTNKTNSNEETSPFTAALLFTNATIGIGIINLPESYEKTGSLALALSIHLAVFFISTISHTILAHISDKNQRTHFQDIMFDFYGEKLRIFSSTVILVTVYFYSSSLLVIVSDQVEEFLIFVDQDFYCHQRPWYINRNLTIIYMMLLILPFCFYKYIALLKHISTIGSVAFVYISILVTVKYFQPHPPPGPVKKTNGNTFDIVYLIVNILVCYTSQICSVPIYASMKHRNLWKYFKVVSISLSTITILYLLLAISGSLTFGSYINSDILLSYRNPDVSILIAVILLAVKALSGYSIVLYPGRSAVRTLWCLFWKLTDEEAEKREDFQNNIISLMWIVTNVILAIIFENIKYFIAFSGPFIITIAFLLPVVCFVQYIQITENKKHWKYYLLMVLSISFIILGTILIVLSVIVMFYQYSHIEIKHPACKTIAASQEPISNVTLI